MADNTASSSSRLRGPLWRRRRRLEEKDRSRSEMTLNQVCGRSTSLSSSSSGHSTQFASAHNIHLDSALAGPSKVHHGYRHAFLLGKRSAAGPSVGRKKVGAGGIGNGPGARIGYMLAFTGAKMGLAPCLSSESLIQLGSSPRQHRSVGVQTEVATSVSAGPAGSGVQSTLPVGIVPCLDNSLSSASPGSPSPMVWPSLELSSPLYACLAPLVSAAHLDKDLRRHRALQTTSFTSTSSSVGPDPPTASPPTTLHTSRPSISVIPSDEPRCRTPTIPCSPPASLAGTPTSSCIFNPNDSGDAYGPLLHPLKALNIARRKSSTGDSAVDLKFAGDEERSVHSGGPPSPLAPSTPSEAALPDIVVEAAKETPHVCRPVEDQRVRPSSTASWRKLRNVVVWAPFFQQYQRHKYPWIQLAGHQGNFRAGEQGTILKKHCVRECLCMKALMKDVLRPYVPEFKGEVIKDNEQYVCMQDLLMEFESPSLMDCKLGLRTYLEEELTKAKDNPTPRTDMYEKMVAVDVKEPTEEEHRCRGVTKPRYMQWRETISSTATLGFRIEGIKHPVEENENGEPSEKMVSRSSNDFKRTKTRDEVKACLKDFTDDNPVIMEKYCQRLRSIAATLECSEFFRSHELIGSSLLFVHDRRGKVNIWMIDFGKTMPLPEGVTIDHRSPWIEGNHEDGYLFGLYNMSSIFEQLLAESSCANETTNLGNEPATNSLSASNSAAAVSS